MKTHKHITSLALLAAGIVSVAAQETNILKLYTALEVEFPTQIGKLYTLQGSSDLTTWTDVGQAIYGHGRTVDKIFSTKTLSNITFAMYRLKVDDATTNGYAPWKQHGRWIAMGDDSNTNVIRFDDDSHGHNTYGEASENFEYKYSRTGENEAEIERHYSADREDRVTISYTGPGEGTWVREEFRNGGLERRHMGRFHSSTNDPGTTPPPVVVPPPQPGAAPATLTASRLHILAGELPVELKFLSATNGYEEVAESRHGTHLPEVPFTYEYTVLSSNTASLNLTFPTNTFDGDRNEYDLTYTDGASGTFTRRIIRAGAVASTDTGIFGPDHTEIEADDDHGGHGTEPGDDNGTGVEPGDDNGTGIEPGDDSIGGSGSSGGGGETDSGGGRHGGSDDGAIHG
jgi:hypothetical protein